MAAVRPLGLGVESLAVSLGVDVGEVDFAVNLPPVLFKPRGECSDYSFLVPKHARMVEVK